MQNIDQPLTCLFRIAVKRGPFYDVSQDRSFPKPLRYHAGCMDIFFGGVAILQFQHSSGRTNTFYFDEMTRAAVEGQKLNETLDFPVTEARLGHLRQKALAHHAKEQRHILAFMRDSVSFATSFARKEGFALPPGVWWSHLVTARNLGDAINRHSRQSNASFPAIG